MMSDEQVLALTSVIHKNEIEEAKLAQQKAKDPRVKRLAGTVMSDHTTAKEREQRMMSQMGLKPQETDQSRALEQESQRTMERLRAMTGSAFDRTYIDAQIREHTDVLQLPSESLEELGVSEREVQMAETLVEGMHDAFDPAEFKDEYRDDVMALIERKAKAGEINTVTEPEKRERPARAPGKVVDLMSLLKQSVDARAPSGRGPGRTSKKRARRSA